MDELGNKPITKEDIITVRITGFSNPKNWYAVHVGTERKFKVVRQRIELFGKVMEVYLPFFEGFLYLVERGITTYEKILMAYFIELNHAEVVEPK